MTVQQLTRPAAEPGAETSVAPSTLKTILVHIQNESTAVERIETALSIARASSAHLTCLHVTSIEAYVAFDGFGGLFIMNDVMKSIDEEAERLRALVEDELRNEDVSWDFVQNTSHFTAEVLGHGALADLIVTGREPRNVQLGMPAVTLLGDLLQTSRTPLLIPGAVPIDPAGPAIIAWNGSFEAANAVRLSLGLLKLASSVRVVNVTGVAQKKELFPGTRLLEYLSRQGIEAELVVETLAGADDDVVSAALMSHARAVGAYIVMGAYGHSRLREFLFGGVTRTMLNDAPVPLVIAR